MWEIRNKSIEALENKLKPYADLIYKGFKITDDIILKLYNPSDTDEFIRVCGFALLKGKNYCHGIFCLELEGLAQEAGALLRTTIECIELLEYFYQNPLNIKKALNNKLPSAGEIAKLINGQYKELRKHLNECSSHFKFKVDSVRHLIDSNTRYLKLYQSFNEDVLKKNLSMLLCFMIQLAINGAECLDKGELLQESLAYELNSWKANSLQLINPTHGNQEKI